MTTIRDEVRRLLGARPRDTENRRLVLEGNRMAREGRVVTRHAPFAEHMCRIPLEDLPMLNKRFPGFDGRSGTEAHNMAMREFHASPLSTLYDVRKRDALTVKNRPRGIIIRPPAPKEDRP